MGGQSWFALRIFALVCIVFIIVAWIYDLGIKQGQISALKTAYEVCRKVAPCGDVK